MVANIYQTVYIVERCEQENKQKLTWTIEGNKLKSGSSRVEFGHFEHSLEADSEFDSELQKSRIRCIRCM